MSISTHLFKTCPKTGKIVGLRTPQGWYRIAFFAVGILSVIWFLIRVVPKPSRASYPCMKATMPIAYSFISYIITLVTSIVLFKKTAWFIKQKKFQIASIFALLTLCSGLGAIVYYNQDTKANPLSDALFVDPIGVNKPIGEAKGIFPGRVVWVFNPKATNQECIPNEYGHAYFMDENCDQAIVNQMVSETLQKLTGTTNDEDAWKAIFIYFNKSHNKGEVGYTTGEKIFIKVNSVHAWNTDSQGNIKKDGDYGNIDTSPQVVMAMLTQLIEKAKIPQEMISIGDPFTQMFNHCYTKYSAKYPKVTYVSRDSYAGRTKVTKQNMKTITYSDKGTVLGQKTDQIVDCVSNAEYLLDIPAMKGHRWAGVTFFAKNFFGVNSRSGSSHLHPGLHRVDYDLPLRDQYKSYRVFVDLLGSKLLGQKTLVYLMDGLWATSEEHKTATPFETAPFNGSWSSSILASLDPIAIESVCLDILQKEFTEEDLTQSPPRYTFVQWPAIDDYLHQAASKEWWPEGITYDPDNTGKEIASLGVHEHWNNVNEMQYTRNLKSGNGIELIKSFYNVPSTSLSEHKTISNLTTFPNPLTETGTIQFVNTTKQLVKLSLLSATGQTVSTYKNEILPAGTYTISISKNNLKIGTYVIRLQTENKVYALKLSIQ